ncbi:unannotated protein [freshwater metagenome]|uniref:Unannotated protein n=1 Tax=freshwater metagenome TaxID=449393 RepID=A0A6J6NAI4_9ZZZZ
MVSDSAELAGDTFPAGSVITVLTDHSPSLNEGKSQLLTDADATYVQDTVVPSAFLADTVTEVPAGKAPPDKDGVVSDVRLSVAEAPVSDEATRSGVPAVGAEASMESNSAELAGDTFPAGSVITVLTDHSPSLNEGKSQLLTDADATYVHDTVVPSDFLADTVTEVPAGSTPPETDGVESDVRLSVAEAPVSDAFNKSGAPGADADVAIVIDNADVLPVLPEASVTFATTDHAPSVKVPRVHDDATPTVYVHVTSVAPGRLAVMTTTSPVAWPVSENAGVASDVLLSVEDEPVSDDAARSTASPPTAFVSIPIESDVGLLLVLPAGSVTDDVMVHVPSPNVGNVQFVALPTTYEQVTVFVPFVALSVMVSPELPPVALNVGVLSFVLLSVLLVPVSELVARSGTPGAAGALASIETDNAADAVDAPEVG